MEEREQSLDSELRAILEKHVQAELNGDLETTMGTMSSQPHLLHVPTMMGGSGYDEVRHFYQNHLVGCFFPPDVKIQRISLTVGKKQIVDELFISFTHTTEMGWLAPGVAPTGKTVEIAVVVIAGLEEKKLTHEHIYWDQASVLIQLGLLDPKGLPAYGNQSTQKLLEFCKNKTI